MEDLRNIDIADLRNTNVTSYLTNIYQNNSTEFNLYALTHLQFANDVFSLKIVRYNVKHKIAKYKTVNYHRYPIYSSIPTINAKVILNIKRKINLQLFCENQIRDYLLSDNLLLLICNYLHYEPTYLKYIKQIATLKQENKQYQANKKQFVPLKTDYQTTLSVTPKWKTKLFKFFSFGHFIPVTIDDVNQEKAEIDALNAKNQAWNEKTQNEIEIWNNEQDVLIKHNNEYINQLMALKNRTSNINKTTDGWINLRDDLWQKHEHLMYAKGIYLIWNKTKNKYYVGQSKNIGKRIFSQHFNNGDVKNIIFAKDWYNGDEFYYQCILKNDASLNLDALEKEYIEKYNSFKNGYNKTGGNW